MRRIAVVLTVWAACLVLPTGRSQARVSAGFVGDLCASLEALALPRASAQAIGRAYLKRHSHEADPRRLATAVASALGPLPAPAAVLRARLREQIRRDFEEESTVWVEGWLLARTEARLCAVAALT